MENKKIVWAYLVEQGRLTTGEWSYYGGNWEHPDGYKYRKVDAAEKNARGMIRSKGVDWSKTRMPVGAVEQAFTDSYHDSEKVETLLGTLYLLDGTEFLFGCTHVPENIGALVISERMVDENLERVKAVFGE